MPNILTLLAIATVGIFAAVVWLLQIDSPGAPPWVLFGWMSPEMKLLAFAIVILTFAGARAGLARNLDRVRKSAILALALGVLGVVIGELHTHFGWLIDNVITFETLAPMRATSLTMLLLGLFAALTTVGLFQLSGGVRRT